MFAHIALSLFLAFSPLQQPAAPQTGSASAAPSQKPAAQPHAGQPSEEELQKKEQSKRIFGLVPSFGSTSRQNAAPLTTQQKYHLFAKQAFDPVEFGVAGAQAGIGQATDEFHDYGQGAEGYAKRYGATLADSVSSSFFSNAFYPSLLKQDPRFFRLGEGKAGVRARHALEEEFWAHQDRGGRGLNWSNILGAFTSGGISNAYYPASDRGFDLTMSRSAIAIGYGSLGGLVGEFWPDVQRKLLGRIKKNSAKATP